MKKTVWTLLTVILIMALCAGCGSVRANTESAEDKDTVAGAEKLLTIGVVQYIEHSSLDSAYRGFLAALEDAGYMEKVTLDVQNAQGDVNNLSTIADRFVGADVDLVLSVTTDATQIMASKTTQIPIVATAVTSYLESGLVQSEEKPGGNVTGTSDMNPVTAQIDLLVDLVPDVKSIGIIYNAGEDNSVLQVNMAKEHIKALGIGCHEVNVTNSAEVQQAIQSLAGKCDAVYVPTDNVVASAMPTVHSVAMDNKLPVIVATSDMAMEGGLATMGISYYEIGYQAGEMAVEILDNGANPGEMPIQYAKTSDEIVINGLVAEEIGYTVPEEYLQYVIYPE